MHVSLRHRYLTVIEHSIRLLPIHINIMAPSIAPGGRKKGKTSIANNGSTASSPSLRSKTPVLVDESQPSVGMGPPGGNVKVVVRVRGFLQRGKIARILWRE